MVTVIAARILIWIGAVTVTNKVVVPAASYIGELVGKGIGATVNKLTMIKVEKAIKKAAKKNEQITEKEILALLCAEEKTK